LVSVLAGAEAAAIGAPACEAAKEEVAKKVAARRARSLVMVCVSRFGSASQLRTALSPYNAPVTLPLT
jgi:hypothetical protein